MTVITHLEHLRINIDHLEHMNKKHPSVRQLCGDKCGTKDTLCNDRDDICKTMLKTLEMSVTDVFIVRITHLHKDRPLKPPKQAHIYHMKLNMQKDDTLIFLQIGAKHLDQTHAMSLNICDDNMQYHGRIQNLGVGQNMESVVTAKALGDSLVEVHLLYLG